MFELAKQDEFKLSILLKTARAIRIDNYKLEIIGLVGESEKIIKLSPEIDSDLYIKEVQKFLTEKVLGVVGGYPAYLQRWSKMGQVDSSNLANLLKIGEIGATIAVANSKYLTVDLLPLVWWSATNTDSQAEIGRYLLMRDDFLVSDTAKEIAKFLLEFLPFSENPLDLLNTTNLILQENLISAKQKLKLWKMGARKSYILVSFLARQKGNLPSDNLPFLTFDNPELAVASGEQNQIFIRTCKHILNKINEEHTLYKTLEVIHQHFSHPNILRTHTIDDINLQLDNLQITDRKLRARMFLAGVNENLVISEISAHNLSGSTIRKKLSSILSPITDALTTLSK
jgi:hypothetical protein